jgi:hypothetical protein
MSNDKAGLEGELDRRVFPGLGRNRTRPRRPHQLDDERWFCRDVRDQSLARPQSNR